MLITTKIILTCSSFSYTKKSYNNAHPIIFIKTFIFLLKLDLYGAISCFMAVLECLRIYCHDTNIGKVNIIF